MRVSRGEALEHLGTERCFLKLDFERASGGRTEELGVRRDKANFEA